MGTVGQPRALDAIEFGLEVETRGFNLFVSGPPGSGRLTTVLDYLRGSPPRRPAPADWVYVHNFANARPAERDPLPAGRGAELATAMDEFVEAARREIPRAFESEEYERRQREIVVGDRRASARREEEELTRVRGRADSP